MAVMEIGLPSGYVADVDALPSILQIPKVKRVETQLQDTSVVIYFDRVRSIHFLTIEILSEIILAHFSGSQQHFIRPFLVRIQLALLITNLNRYSIFKNRIQLPNYFTNEKLCDPGLEKLVYFKINYKSKSGYIPKATQNNNTILKLELYSYPNTKIIFSLSHTH